MLFQRKTRRRSTNVLDRPNVRSRTILIIFEEQNLGKGRIDLKLKANAYSVDPGNNIPVDDIIISKVYWDVSKKIV